MKRIILISLLLYAFLSIAQTPPAKTWYFNTNGAKTTVKEKWNEDAQGLKHGSYIKYFENGEREILGTYNHDKATGEWVFTIYTDLLFNRIKSMTYTHFTNGIQDGSFKTISGDKIIIEGNYTNGLKTGFWKDDYSISDQVYREGNYINGKRDGEWKNTNAITLSQDTKQAIQIGRYDNGNSTQAEDVKVETAKGYKATFKNGQLINVYDDKGANLIQKRKEEAQAKTDEDKRKMEEYELEKQESAFNYAIRGYYDGSTFYGNITYLQSFIKDFPNAPREYIEAAKNAIALKPDNDDFFEAKNHIKSVSGIVYFTNYLKNFPNGFHKGEVDDMMKECLLYNKSDLLKQARIELSQNRPNECIAICEVFLKNKEELSNTYYLPASIYYSISCMLVDNQEKAFEVAKTYHNETINYSDGDKAYLDSYKDTHRIFKKDLDLGRFDKTYKQIIALK